MTQEVIIVGEDVFVMAPPFLQARYENGRDDWNNQDFDLFKFLDYHRLLGFYYLGSEASFWLPEDLAEEISISEQQFNGEHVYYITGPPALYRNYPLMGPSALDGVLEYWIGSEDYLLRRFEVSGVMCEGTDHAQRLSGWISLSDFGETVDIQPPVHEGPDDHGNSPSTATEISVGEPVLAVSVDEWVDRSFYSHLPFQLEEGQEPVTGSVDSWLDLDYFQFQAEEGQQYAIVIWNERTESGSGTRSTLHGPVDVTPELGFSRSHGSTGSRILWQATASGTYYLRVERGYSGTVPYTLTVTPLDQGVDDHGNTPSTATEVSVGEPVAAASVDEWLRTFDASTLPFQSQEGQKPVTGSVDSWIDLDYFRFQAEEGQNYVIVVRHELTEFGIGIRSTLFGPDGVTPESISHGSYLGAEDRVLWQASVSGTYYLRVGTGHTGMVPYTLTVTPVE